MLFQPDKARKAPAHPFHGDVVLLNQETRGDLEIWANSMTRSHTEMIINPSPGRINVSLGNNGLKLYAGLRLVFTLLGEPPPEEPPGKPASPAQPTAPGGSVVQAPPVVMRGGGGSMFEGGPDLETIEVRVVGPAPGEQADIQVVFIDDRAHWFRFEGWEPVGPPLW